MENPNNDKPQIFIHSCLESFINDYFGFFFSYFLRKIDVFIRPLKKLNHDYEHFFFYKSGTTGEGKIFSIAGQLVLPSSTTSRSKAVATFKYYYILRFVCF